MYKEASWDGAPGLTEGALGVDLSAHKCNLNYWIEAVAQGTWKGLVNGHKADAVTPIHMKRPGPLRDAMIEEMAFRTIAEEMATRALSYLVVHAPDRDTMEFYLTQAVDEARHSSVFRGHLIEVGLEEDKLPELIEKYAGRQRDIVLKPLEQWVLEVMRDQKDFLGGVVIFTILVEGILAPAAEISELKWRLLDPAAAQIERGANIDEIRHLTVGASVIKEHIARHPEARAHVMEIIKKGVQLWDDLPSEEVVLQRERLFQEGMKEHEDLLANYELVPGRLLLDTTPEERMDIAHEMTRDLQRGRLTYMNLQEAIEYLV
ncbi:MAG: hypothetical protein Tsb002_00330 [Wenzhouxiangellaceae bacterium]